MMPQKLLVPIKYNKIFNMLRLVIAALACNAIMATEHQDDATSKVQAYAKKLDQIRQARIKLENRLQVAEGKLSDCLEKQAQQREVQGQGQIEAKYLTLLSQFEEISKKAQLKDNECRFRVQELKFKGDECSVAHNTLLEKIKSLEAAASSKVHEIGHNIKESAKNLGTRLRNFLTGKGPYTAEDQELFGEFKQQVASLQEQIKENSGKSQKLQQEKDDVDLQQQYCRAQLADLDDEIVRLEQRATQEGKKYYIEQIKKLKQERSKRVSSTPQDSTKDELNHLELQKKLEALSKDYMQLLNGNRELQLELIQVSNGLESQKQQADKLRYENDQLQSQNSQMKQLIQQIHAQKYK